MESIRNNIALWYYIMRTIAIVILLGILIYVGIRMALSTVASDKAVYKKMLIDWATSLALVFLLHYIIIITISVNQRFVLLLEGIEEDSGGLVSATAQLLLLSLNLNVFVGFGALILFIALQIETFIFLFTYIKRMFTVAFLIIIAPLITITYSMDKMGDQKAQALNNWLKEFMINVLIQPFHCILYLAFVTTAIGLLNPGATSTGIIKAASFVLGDGSIGGFVLALIALKFIMDGEKIIKKIFGLDKANSLANPLTAAALMASTAQKAQNLGGAVKGVTNNKYVNQISNKLGNTKIGQKVTPAFNNLKGKYEDKKQDYKTKKMEEYKENARKSGKPITDEQAESMYNKEMSDRKEKFNLTKDAVRKSAAVSSGALVGLATYLASDDEMAIAPAVLMGHSAYKATNSKVDEWQKRKKTSYEQDSVGNFQAYARSNGLNGDLSSEEGMKNYRDYVNSNYNLGKYSDHYSDDMNKAASEKMTKALGQDGGLGFSETEIANIKGLLARALNDENAGQYDPEKFFRDNINKPDVDMDAFLKAILPFVNQQLGSNMYNYTSQFDSVMESSGISHEDAVENVQRNYGTEVSTEETTNQNIINEQNDSVVSNANMQEAILNAGPISNNPDDAEIDRVIENLKAVIEAKLMGMEASLGSEVSDIQSQVDRAIQEANGNLRMVDLTAIPAGEKREYAQTYIQQQYVNNNNNINEIRNNFQNIINNQNSNM